jgi:hypothetical protein
MISCYNGKLRAYLIANRIMESPAFHTISGRDMIRRFGYRQCPWGRSDSVRHLLHSELRNRDMTSDLLPVFPPVTS